MKTHEFFDARDTTDPVTREAALFERFGERLAEAATACPGLGRHLDGHDLRSIDSRAALARLPLLTKEALVGAQQSAPPLGGFLRPGALAGTRLFMSPGPVWEPQLAGSDPWAGARSLHAAGFRTGDVVHNAFSYHRTPGGLILDEGARALGCTVYPAGVGDTAAQVEALRGSGAVAWTGTPDYLKVLLDHATADGAPLTTLRRAMVSGGALFPALRDIYREAGIRTMQCYATADLGVIAYESESDGLVHPGMLVNEDLILEICKPGTGEPAAADEVGEVVVTRLHPDYPLVRFGTGDLSRLVDEPSPCGRTVQRIAGWMGRADQRTKVRGMFVDPRQVQAVRAAHPEIESLRLLVERHAERDVMTLEIVAPSLADESPTIAAIGATVKAQTSLSGDVRRVESIPNDGTVVRDLRDPGTGS